VRKRELLVTGLVSLTFMIVLDQVFNVIGFPGWWIGNYLSVYVIIIGIVSSLLSVFISFRTILKVRYSGNFKKGLFLGISTPVFFMVYVSIVVGTYYTDIPFSLWLREWALPVFVSSLIGCLTGFLLGGSRLEKMPAPQPRISRTQPAMKEDISPAKTGAWMVLFLLVGAVMGYFGGYIVWVLFGQVQLALGVFPPYAALFPPPLIYQVGWTVSGALSFPFKILPKLLK
jgi:hypothetical protein